MSKINRNINAAKHLHLQQLLSSTHLTTFWMGTHKDAARVAILAGACKGALQAKEGARLSLALGLVEVYPPLDLHKTKEIELNHQHAACTHEFPWKVLQLHLQMVLSWSCNVVQHLLNDF